MTGIYSNFDQSFEFSEPEKELKKNPNQKYQHSAWDFCGYISFNSDKDIFVEEIWRYNCHVDTLSDISLKNLIETANLKYGSD